METIAVNATTIPVIPGWSIVVLQLISTTPNHNEREGWQLSESTFKPYIYNSVSNNIRMA